MRILIIQTAFIGDVILATPVIEKLNEFYPNSEIDFLLRKGNEELLENNPYVSSILIWNKRKNKLINLLKIIRHIRGIKYDYIINLQRFFSTGFLTIFSKGKIKIGFDKNPFSFLFSKKIKHIIKKGIHEINRNICLIEELTDNKIINPKIYPSDDDFASVAKYKLQPYICIAPISVWFTKQFPSDKWIELINNLDNELKVYLIGGKDDISACEKIIKDCENVNIVSLCGKLNLLQSAALMKNAKMNYTNDSAPLHIASAIDARTTVIFCSTIPEFGFGPLSNKARIVQTKEILECRPCGLHGLNKCPENHFKCGITINPEQLLF